MTKNRFLLGALAMALVFGMVLIGCKTESDDDSGGGSLTITGLTDYEGKYAWAMGAIANVGDVELKCGNFTGINTEKVDNYTNVQISDGRVTLPVWKREGMGGDAPPVVTRYSGSERVVIYLSIYSSAGNQNGNPVKEGDTNVLFSGGSKEVDASLFVLKDPESH